MHLLLTLFSRPVRVLALLFVLAQPAVAQYESSSFGTQKRVVVSATKYAEAQAAARTYLQRRALRMLKQQETPQQLTAEFTLPANRLGSLDSLAASLGYVLENNLTAMNLEDRIQTLRDEEADTKNQLARQEAELKQLQTRKPDTAQISIQRTRIDNTTAALRRLRTQLAAYDANAQLAYVTLQVYDEITFPTGNSSVNFVNMPGVEMGLLRLENPKPGTASRFYKGYAVKYLFTRGKSYFNVGLYKPTTTTGQEPDSTFVSEMFMFNFGQDFYPRHLGRGGRRFLNVYTTYQAGGFILNRRNDDNEWVWNANLGLGLELIKTKNLLIDTKASYFMPLNGLNRELRGVLLQGAVNFVF